MLRLSIAFFFLLFISCKKGQNCCAFSMQGKWQLTEIYDGHTAWGGCNCWKTASGSLQHTLEFGSGTYKITPAPISSFSGCTGNYEWKNDSTIVWNRCGGGDYEAKISYSGPNLLIEERQFAGLYIYKYKRLR